MSRLLSAGFARLWKSAVFYVCILLMAGFSLLISCFDMSRVDGNAVSVSAFLFRSAYTVFPIVLSTFVGLFVGTEYSNGTIRNKLMVGHSRIAIYLSNLVVSSVAAIIMLLTNMALTLGAGFFMCKKEPDSIAVLAGCIVCTMISAIAFTAVFLLISMLIQSKAVGAVTVILVSLALLSATEIVAETLMIPEYDDTVNYFWGEDGVMLQQEIVSDKIPNPAYVSGTKRKVYEFLLNVCPNGQNLQVDYLGFYSDDPFGTMDALPYFPAYSLVVILLFSSGGILLFRRKNIK